MMCKNLQKVTFRCTYFRIPFYYINILQRNSFGFLLNFLEIIFIVLREVDKINKNLEKSISLFFKTTT